MTKREMYVALLAMDSVKAVPKIVEGIQHEIDLLNKKASAERKPTKVQQENENLKIAITEYLRECGSAKAVKELLVEVPELAGLSTSKVASLVTALWNKGEGVLNRETVKKVNYYTLKEGV